MATSRENAVFDDLEDDEDDPSSQSPDEDDDIDNDDVLPADDEDEDDEEEEEDIRSISTVGTSAVPIAVPSASVVTIAAVPNGSENHHKPIPDLQMTTISSTGLKRQRIIPAYETMTSLPPQQSQQDRKPQPVDEARRLFQRLWTDEDEIELLRGFLDYTAQRGGGGPHLDNAMFYDQIKSKLQLDFNKNQLVEKLRRLKKKYRNVISKISSGKEFSFKSPHDQATFEISKKIWSSSFSGANLDDEDGDVKLLDDHPARFTTFSNSSTPSKKRSRPGSKPAHITSCVGAILPSTVKIDGNVDNTNENTSLHNNKTSSYRGGNISSGGWNGAKVSGLIEETVRSCLSPLYKELFGGAASVPSTVLGASKAGIAGLMVNSMPLGFGLWGAEPSLLADERWRKQQILELEVYSKRLELVQDQIREHLDELRSTGSGGA